ncbi:MAG: D-glycero-beta-D-manno-heptose-7-phosphate kinase [Pseudolabrys sp.]|nr:D-glycero-beta-D-manno-heptose-7-phosphate kinase [Pseudolabrys sp.]MDP2296029.1 D-glycero-beta-D-manno-heptose-7-phosphate kinase [Pseudolabrys sp.]
MFDFDKHLTDLGDQTVLCVGDLMLDEFVYGSVTRISPEAPTPVIAVKRTEVMVGGAGNVARNLVALGARCIFVGVVGDDDAGNALTKALTANSLIEFELVIDPMRQTTRKVRFVSEHHSSHLLRADWESAGGINAAAEDALIAHALAAMSRAGSVVLSDYAKGALTPCVVRAVIDAANKLGKPVIVDPKGRDYSIYSGATMITPNRQELAAATNTTARSDDEIVEAAAGLKRALGAQAVLVTRSEDGMTLVSDGEPVHVPSYAVKVRDVSGAGDTVVAVLSAMLATNADFESAMRAANAAAAVVVGKRGTATLTVAELRSRILPAASLAPEEKIVFDWALLDEHLDDWRKQGLRIGFTNGCFDILHPGHVKLLAGARAACDRLVLGLNGDASVKRLKGEGRPVQNVQSRAEVLAALEAVDLVVVFDEDTPKELIARVKPTVLVKGGDYKREDVVGHDIVEALGGSVVLIDLVPGQSTTGTILALSQFQLTQHKND